LALALALATIALGLSVSAQQPAAGGRLLEDEPVRARHELILAAREYRTKLDALSVLLERDVARAEEELVRRRSLHVRGVATRREVAAVETELDAAREHLGVTRSRIAEAEAVIVEAEAADVLAALPAARRRGNVATWAVIRSRGTREWSVQEISSVDVFFTREFGRRAPVSGYGQTALHDRLGFDHRNAVDVAVHPDSAEGRALIAYLRGAGVPFTAFRSAVPGASTGAHIHVGRPSSRLRWR
jgi:hypothetical protein